jgi:hypothetical protein
MNSRMKSFSQRIRLYVSHFIRLAFRSQKCFFREWTLIVPKAKYDINNEGIGVRSAGSTFQNNGTFIVLRFFNFCVL